MAAPAGATQAAAPAGATRVAVSATPRPAPDAPPASGALPSGAVDLSPVVARFDDPARYLRRRERGLAALGKRAGERRAIRRVLALCGPLQTVLDCPSGPGRLFAEWARNGRSVVGLDRSPAMVQAARQELRRLRVPGSVLRGEVEALGRSPGGRFDLVASIRFVYYFDARARPVLLRLLARHSRRWVLVQYKTTETWKGRRNLRRGRGQGKHFLSLFEIRAELAAAGLRLVSFETHGPLSDRALALAEVSRA